MPLRLESTHHTRMSPKGPWRHLHPTARTRLPSVAVLPFRSSGPSPCSEHLTEGIAGEVLQLLNQAEGLWVVARTTAFRYGGSDLPLADIGRRLRADAVLGGSLRREGERLTLEARLVKTATGLQLWTQTWDFQRRELFATLEVLARRVLAELGLAASFRPLHPVDVEAYEWYLRGRQHYFRFNRQGMAQASEAFHRALALDPAYASAWAALANCAAYAYIYVERAEPQRELAESCSRQALALDPDLAEGHASRGVALSAAGEAEAAEEAFETALRLDPNLYEAAYFYARHCFAHGKLERAIEFFEWAAALRPEDFQAILLVAQVYHSLGLEDEAARARKAGLALVEARLEEAPDDVRARYLGANALVALGEREKGLDWARTARRLDPDDPMLLYNLGCIHALAGDAEEALSCLCRAVSEGLSQKGWLLHDGDLDAIRSHPRFQELMSAMEG